MDNYELFLTISYYIQNCELLINGRKSWEKQKRAQTKMQCGRWNTIIWVDSFCIIEPDMGGYVLIDERDIIVWKHKNKQVYNLRW